MLLNDLQREMVRLLKFTVKPREIRLERLSDLEGLAFDAVDRTQPKLESRTKHTTGLLVERVEKQFLGRFVQSQPALDAACSGITGRRRSELHTQTRQPMAFKDRLFEIY